MPLIHSKSDNARSENIAELIKAGHSPAQSEAIAYKEQREAESKDIELKTPKAFSKAGFKSKFKREWNTSDTGNESARTHDLNDFMEVKGNNISKIGVFPYSGAQIGSPELEPDKIYMVYRPEESLADPETLESFKLIPFTDEHAMLGSEDGMMPAEEKGVHGVIGEDVYYERPYLKANIKIFSEQLKNLISEGKKELSIGYRCAYEYNPGIFGDQQYDFIQREIRGNHLALVDEGRSGPDVSVLDKLQFTYDTISLVNSKNLAEKNKMPAKDEMIQEDEGMSLEECANLVKELAMKVDKLIGAGNEDENPELSEKAAAQGDEGDPDAFVERADITDSDEDPSEEEAKKKEKNLMKREQGEDEDEYKKEGDNTKPDGDTEKKGGAMDTKSLLREISSRDSLAAKLSQHIGTFDHKEKTLAEVAKYGLKQLGLKCKPGHEESVLVGYLAGAKISPITTAQDSAPKASGIKNYLEGVK